MEQFMMERVSILGPFPYIKASFLQSCVAINKIVEYTHIIYEGVNPLTFESEATLPSWD